MPWTSHVTEERLLGPTPSSPPSWLRWVTGGFLALTVALILVYGATPDVRIRQIAFFLGHLASVVAVGIGAHTARRGFRGDWHLIFGAVAIWVAAEAAAMFEVDASYVPRAWALGVALTLIASALMSAGMIRLARRDGFVRGSAVWLDGAVYLVATTLVWWLIVGHDLSSRSSLPAPGVLTAAVAPIGDALLLAGASALTSSRAAHSRSARALVCFALAGLVGDLGYARLALGHPFAATEAVPVVWMVQFAGAGVASLASAHPARREQSRLPVTAILLLVAALVAPSLLGVFVVTSAVPGLAVGPLTLVVLAVGTVGMAALASVRATLLIRHVERQAEDLDRTARTDELTTLPNRRAGDRLLHEAIRAAEEGDAVLHLALIDLDHFKDVNDTFGHQHGDRLLRAAGMAWPRALDGRGTVFRYGGEEFVVLLPGVDDPEDVMWDLQRATPFDQTFSAGLVTLQPGEDAHSLIGRADAALYRAKAAGRARTVRAA